MVLVITTSVCSRTRTLPDMKASIISLVVYAAVYDGITTDGDQ